MQKLVRGVGVAGLLLALVGCVPVGAVWHFGTLDGHQNGPNGQTVHAVGNYPAAIEYGGVPHVFYHDGETEPDGDDLRHGWWTGSHWQFETIDGDHADAATGRIDGPAGFFTAATVFGGAPHVFHFGTSHFEPKLRHTWWTGALWRSEYLDGYAGAYGQIDSFFTEPIGVAIYGSGPHLFYVNYGGVSPGQLRHSWWDGTRWRAETLDAATTNKAASALVYNGQLHIFYRQGSALKHRWWTGSAWLTDLLDGIGSPAGNGRLTTKNVGLYSAAILYDGLPHVFSKNVVDDDLRHAWWTGSAWQAETIDAAGDTGTSNVAVIYDGRPHVFTKKDSEILRHVWWTGSGWMAEDLADGFLSDGLGSVYFAALPWGLQLHVFGRRPSDDVLRQVFYG